MLRALNEWIRSLDLRLERLYDALETGKLNITDLAPRIKAPVARRTKLGQARLEVKNNLSDRKIDIGDMLHMRSYLADLKSLLGSAPILEQKVLLKSFLRSTEVSNSEICVNYTLPMPRSDDCKEKIGVLDFKSNGRPCRSRTCDTLIKRYKRFVPEHGNK